MLILQAIKVFSKELGTVIRGIYKGYIEPALLIVPVFLKYLSSNIHWYAGGWFSKFRRSSSPSEDIKSTSVNAQATDVIFVGAGPTGLWTAIQLKLYTPILNILIFEKYTEYTRNRDVFIEKTSFADAHKNAEFQKLITDFPAKISVNILEGKLLEFAQQLGIQVRYENIEDCESLSTRFPDVRAIIGSDGSRSRVRTQIFNNELFDEYNVSYMVEVKYKTTGVVSSLSLFSRATTVIQSDYYFKEVIKREKDEANTLCLRAIVDKETFESLGEANFKHPGRFDDNLHKKCPLLHKTVKNWLSARGNEQFAPGGEPTINKIRLDVYQAKHVVKCTEKGIWWCLVGDAAFGLPYFRSLNSGLLNGTQLALNLHHYLSGQKSDLNDYEHYFRSLAAREKSAVAVKNLALNTYVRKVYDLQWSYSRFKSAINYVPGLFSIQSQKEQPLEKNHRVHSPHI